jgi:hypothetical protein
VDAVTRRRDAWLAGTRNLSCVNACGLMPGGRGPGMTWGGVDAGGLVRRVDVFKREGERSPPSRHARGQCHGQHGAGREGETGGEQLSDFTTGGADGQPHNGPPGAVWPRDVRERRASMAVCARFLMDRVQHVFHPLPVDA